MWYKQSVSYRDSVDDDYIVVDTDSFFWSNERDLINNDNVKTSLLTNGKVYYIASKGWFKCIDNSTLGGLRKIDVDLSQMPFYIKSLTSGDMVNTFEIKITDGKFDEIKSSLPPNDDDSFSVVIGTSQFLIIDDVLYNSNYIDYRKEVME